MQLSITGDVAAIITASATLLTVIGNFVMGLVQLKRSRENGKKLEENTELTKQSAAKIDDVHAVTDVLKSASGTINVQALRDSHDQGVAEERARGTHG